MATHVGVVSDTHGLVRPETIRALEGVDLIVHAGDVGDPSVLEALAEIAPVRAVRGNVDRGAWADELPRSDVVEVESARLYVIHEISQLDLDPAAAGLHAVISGHSHEPARETRDGVLFLNPGSAGPRRFTLPVALALLRVSGTELEAFEVRLQ